jgi:acetylglutamate kinase
LSASEEDELINGGFIGGGMLPKLNNCTSAIRNGVNRVHILDGRIPHCLLLEIFTNQGVGTAIVADEDQDSAAV